MRGARCVAGSLLAAAASSACALSVVPFPPDGAVVASDAVRPPGDTGPSSGCPGTQVRCNGACTDVSINPFHCGACGTRCNAGDVCVAGACRTPCRAPAMNCGATCVDVTSDPANCGACGRRCDTTETCRAGRCRMANSATFRVEPVSPAPWIEACGAPGATTVLAMADDASTRVALPFELARFWGTTLPAGSPVNVCTNGWIGLDGVANTALSGRLPTGGAPLSVVAAHWTDAYTRVPGICIATTGAAPDRRFVIEWRDAHYCCGDQPTIHLTFEIVLHETSGVIELAYLDASGARGATTGVGNPFGDDAVTPCPDAMCTPSPNSGYRFTPMP